MPDRPDLADPETLALRLRYRATNLSSPPAPDPLHDCALALALDLLAAALPEDWRAVKADLLRRLDEACARALAAEERAKAAERDRAAAVRAASSAPTYDEGITAGLERAIDLLERDDRHDGAEFLRRYL